MQVKMEIKKGEQNTVVSNNVDATSELLDSVVEIFNRYKLLPPQGVATMLASTRAFLLLATKMMGLKGEEKNEYICQMLYQMLQQTIEPIEHDKN